FIHGNGVVLWTVDDIRHYVHLIGFRFGVGQEEVTSNWVESRNAALVSVVLDRKLRIGNTFLLVHLWSNVRGVFAVSRTVCWLSFEPLLELFKHQSPHLQLDADGKMEGIGTLA